ncbi:hypothetical protein PAECIP111891_06659 [Paenibacillus allorhizoplanae]|uniref:Calcineurin-like phosphoesterase domain-containing protein n=1 Tax=Paenibacillus allorhizoplanae TaxID=2905648 RepID=A0ABN8H9P1_9BACL|nr:metallophosphoesterase [Paenibacillus allorhizoplanae]CAH1230373.1 hypothetical protein PAECIP111891_06659 [Paenibacillus allorhizoplanae]
MQTVQLDEKKNVTIFEDQLVTTEKRPWFGSMPSQLGEDFSFVVMGDRCGMATEGVFEKALDLVKDLKPDFVLAVGDLIEGYWNNAADTHQEWDDIDVKIAAMGLPFFPVIGNHDYGNQTMAEVWRERKGLDYYAFRVGDTLFLSLNTEHTPDEFSDAFIDIIKRITADVKREPERANEHMSAFVDELKGQLSPEELQGFGKIKLSLGEEQLAYFRCVLANNADVKWTFVNMHKPGWKSESEEYQELIQMLGNRSYTIFAGHLHAMEYTQKGNAEFIQLGRTGGLAHGDGTNPSDENVVLWVTMRGGMPTYRVIHLDGVNDLTAYQPHQHVHGESV